MGQVTARMPRHEHIGQYAEGQDESNRKGDFASPGPQLFQKRDVQQRENRKFQQERDAFHHSQYRQTAGNRRKQRISLFPDQIKQVRHHDQGCDTKENPSAEEQGQIAIVDGQPIREIAFEPVSEIAVLAEGAQSAFLVHQRRNREPAGKRVRPVVGPVMDGKKDGQGQARERQGGQEPGLRTELLQEQMEQRQDDEQQNLRPAEGEQERQHGSRPADGAYDHPAPFLGQIEPHGNAQHDECGQAVRALEAKGRALQRADMLDQIAGPSQ